jgi:hypothetical protein
MKFVIAALGLLLCGCAGSSTTPESLTHTPDVYLDGSVQTASVLTPEDAKAITIARAAGVVMAAGGGAFGVRGGERDPLVFEVFRVQGGRYVYCHGGWSDANCTVFVSDQWEASKPQVGPPPQDVTGRSPSKSQPATNPAGNHEEVFVWHNQSTLNEAAKLPDDIAKAIVLAREFDEAYHRVPHPSNWILVYEVKRRPFGWEVSTHKMDSDKCEVVQITFNGDTLSDTFVPHSASRPTTQPSASHGPNARADPEVVWRSDSDSETTRHLAPEVARIIMIARAEYEKLPWGGGSPPYTIRVTRWSNGQWAVSVESPTAPKPYSMIIDSDGGVIGGGSS